MTEGEDDLLDVAPGVPHSNILSETLAYVIGLVLALILTGVSFWVASTGTLWGPGVAVGLIVLAIAQMGVHLVFFLHITSGPDNTNNILALAFGVLIVFLVMIVVTQLGNSEFLTEQGIKDLLLNATILVLVAVGQSLVVITRNVDLSVGSILGISAFAAGTYLQGGGNAVVAVLLAVLMGIGFGLLNGLLVSLGQVPALVVTLGKLAHPRGLAVRVTREDRQDSGAHARHQGGAGHDGRASHGPLNDGGERADRRPTAPTDHPCQKYPPGYMVGV